MGKGATDPLVIFCRGKDMMIGVVLLENSLQFASRLLREVFGMTQAGRSLGIEFELGGGG